MAEDYKKKYTICYILVDDKKLFFYNQLLISIASLRKRNPELPISVIMDTDTYQILEENNCTELYNWHILIIKTEIPKDYSQKAKSRFLKTSFRNYLKGDILYIDTDTVIADTLPEIPSTDNLSLVPDWNDGHLDGNEDIAYLQKQFDSCGYHLDIHFPYYNSGIIWAKDTDVVSKFFTEWHKEWKHCYTCDILQDQPSLNYINYKSDGLITPLDNIWNVQICCVNSMRFLDKAYIIHYYNISWNRMRTIYMLSNPEIQKKGYKSAEVKKIIDDPRNAICPSTFIRRDAVLEEVMYSKAFEVLKYINTNHKILFRGFNFLLNLPQRLINIINRYK